MEAGSPSCRSDSMEGGSSDCMTSKNRCFVPDTQLYAQLTWDCPECNTPHSCQLNWALCQHLPFEMITLEQFIATIFGLSLCASCACGVVSSPRQGMKDMSACFLLVHLTIGKIKTSEKSRFECRNVLGLAHCPHDPACVLPLMFSRLGMSLDAWGKHKLAFHSMK